MLSLATYPPSQHPIVVDLNDSRHLSGISEFAYATPLTTSRRPLRERRGVNVTIGTVFHFQPPPIPPKGPLEPHVSNLPRRKKRTSTDRTPTATPGDKAPRPPTNIVYDDGKRPVELQYLQELVPGLFVGVHSQDVSSNGKSIQTGPGYNQTWFTHLVTICRDAGEAGALAGSSKVTVDPMGVRRLRLVIPAMLHDAGVTQLTHEQLAIARTFVSEALPYRQGVHTPSVIPTPPHAVLLSADEHAATDVMSIVGCYLSLVSGNAAHASLMYINQEEDVEMHWRGVVSQDGMEYIDEVAQHPEFAS